MFGFLASQHRKTRRLAADWLELTDKVYHYRRDLLSEAERAELTDSAAAVRQLLREKADTAKLKLGIEALERALRRHGGGHYPKSGLVENVEFLLVAAIVILGLRAFYVQPFKIPTNSMWPSYYGMTGEIFADPGEEPSSVERVARLAAFGASPRRIDAPATGEVLLPVSDNGAYFSQVKGRKWLFFPTLLREYRLVVGNATTESFRVPADFDGDTLLRDAFFPGDKRPLREIIRAADRKGELAIGSIEAAGGRQVGSLLRTGRQVKSGERALSFDVLAGDQLFVDRVSYHFVRPNVGDGFVFRTGNLPVLHSMTPGSPKDQYYIKRLAGVPGDKLRIDEPVLYRNGAPITGVPAFEKNATLTDNYVGYSAQGQFRGGATISVPDDAFVALGDNSANSLDSRYWGTVPAKDVVGRPLFIYFPFTKRWGPSQ